MWHTQTTSLGVKDTPYKRDLMKELIDAFRKEGIAIGLYYSPDDFWWLYQHKIPSTGTSRAFTRGMCRS